MRAFVGTAVLCGAVLLGLALPGSASALGSCGSGGPVGRVDFQGAYYWVTLPPGYDPSREWPLVLGLHGDEGSPEASGSTNWRGLAGTGPFIYVAPKSPTLTGSWYAPNEIVETEKWFDDMLRKLMADYNVDLDRIHAWGLSGGGEFLSYHALSKLQNVMASVQFNMGGNYWGWFLAGGPRRTGACKIATRYATNDGLNNECNGYDDTLPPPPIPGMGTPATGDFLCQSARALHLQMAELGHESVWTEWASVSPCLESRGHCWDDVQAEEGALDWFLSHSLCGMPRPAGGCGEAEFGPEGMNVLDDPSWISGVVPEDPMVMDPATPGTMTPTQPATDPPAAPGTPAPGAPATPGVMVPGGTAGTGGSVPGTAPAPGTTTGTRFDELSTAPGSARGSGSDGGCSVGGEAPGSAAWLMLAVVALLGRRRRASGAARR